MLYSKNGGFCFTITFFGPPHVSEGYFFSSGVTNHDSFSTEGKLEQGKREREGETERAMNEIQNCGQSVKRIRSWSKRETAVR